VHAIRMDITTVVVAAAVIVVPILTHVDAPILIHVDAHTVAVTTIQLVKMMTN
jgi:hypothetical protein